MNYDLLEIFFRKQEKGIVEPSVDIPDKLARLYDKTIDQIVHSESHIPEEVNIEDKTLMEQVKLIQQLDEKDRSTVFNIIDTMLTKRKFMEFFQKNVAALLRASPGQTLSTLSLKV